MLKNAYIPNRSKNFKIIMNLFTPEKKVKNLHIRFGESPFVLLTLFACTAERQKWTAKDIQAVLNEAKKADYKHLVQTLKAHSNSKFE